MQNKVLFLDIDGVLCTRRSHLTYGREGGIWHEWDDLACEAVRKACRNGVRIVISSTWRKECNREDLFAQLTKHGLRDFLHEDWMTPIGNTIRGDEIALWLSRHQEVDSYRILDDDVDFTPAQIDHHLIHTDAEDGMTAENIKRLLNWSQVLKA